MYTNTYICIYPSNEIMYESSFQTVLLCNSKEFNEYSIYLLEVLRMYSS